MGGPRIIPGERPGNFLGREKDQIHVKPVRSEQSDKSRKNCSGWLIGDKSLSSLSRAAR